jgi:uncharacterized protein (UPF0332 family)
MRDATIELYAEKAQESLAGAESEFANGRYNNCVNRCYYACFQAAITALLREGIQPAEGRTQWSHEFVQGRFVGQLINRRKVYPSGLHDTLSRNMTLRHTADYSVEQVTETQASRAIRRARTFVEAIVSRGGE